ncbi:hypothetical protein QTP70_019685, partial [Hemibagrus guttatus]
MFKPKGAQQYTWYQDTLDRRSMIDLVVVSSDLRPHVLDTRVKRGAELSTDHHLVMMLSCWFLQAWTYSMHWGVLQLSVKRSGECNLACTLQVGGEFLSQVEEFKYLGVLFTSEGRMDREIDRQLLHIERGQLRLGHLFRMPLGRLRLRRRCLWEVFRACPIGKRPWGRPRTRWRDYVSRLTWERLWIPPEELEEVSGEREVWASLLRLLPPQPGQVSKLLEVLEAGKKDLSDLDTGYMVMVGQVVQNISKTAGQVGCSYCAVVRTYPKCFNLRNGHHRHLRLTDVCGVKVNPSGPISQKSYRRSVK